MAAGPGLIDDTTTQQSMTDYLLGQGAPARPAPRRSQLRRPLRRPVQQIRNIRKQGP